jgi:anti-sigma regulatory factor (Ser/Thr protein kinase)
LTLLDQLDNWREAPDLFLQFVGVPAEPSVPDGVAREFQEDAMASDEKEGLVQIGEATVVCGPEAARAARALVSKWLDGQAQAELHDDACLLVSELVTNSVRHADLPAGAPLRISTFAVNGLVRVEVEDGGQGAVRIRAADAGDGGFGLRLLELLAARWGVEQEDGTRVWFELADGARST